MQEGLAAQPSARTLNRAGVTGQPGGIVGVTDHNGQPYSLRPKIVINAAGPWIDQVNTSLGLQTWLIGGIKGSHTLLDHPELLRQ